MKAIRATLASSQPIISQDDFNTIFYKVPELHAMHQSFLEGLKKAHDADGAMSNVGEHFRSMVSNFLLFVHNFTVFIYQRRLDFLSNAIKLIKIIWISSPKP
jgi:breakpoint cluster region protein